MTKSVFFLCLSVISGSSIVAQTKTAEALKGESSITYLMVHPLHKIESTSKEFSSKLEIDDTAKEIKTVSAQVDVMTFNSGNSNRDSHAMEVIDAILYPDVSFTSTSVSHHGDSVAVTGKLVFHGQTRDIVIAAVSKWSTNKLEIQGRFDLSLTDFKIERPSLLMIPVEDKLSFSLDAVYVWKSGS
jgi:polyisoprenoid-binding protein YceI